LAGRPSRTARAHLTPQRLPPTAVRSTGGRPAPCRPPRAGQRRACHRWI
jgi:hypothetical protein